MTTGRWIALAIFLALAAAWPLGVGPIPLIVYLILLRIGMFLEWLLKVD